MRDILKATTPANATRQSKPITSAFEAHMGVYIDSQDKLVFPFLEHDRVTSHCRVIESCRTCFHSTGAPSLALPWRLPLRQAPRMMRGLPRCLSSPPPPSCSISTPRRWTSVHDCSPDSRCTIYVLCSRSGYVYMQVSRSSVMFCRSSITQLSCRGGSCAKSTEVISHFDYMIARLNLATL